MSTTMATRAFMPAVPEIESSAAWYRDAPGFRPPWPEARDWRLVERENVRTLIGHCRHDLRVDDVDPLHADFTRKGAACTAPAETYYGMREILITTQDGHRIVFGQDPPRG